ncbi:hypothetical protein [Streptomyces botrytidirepellens]|uniref:Chaplin domain-containing protein n=1 Tax=Streptomyces botrytidirepellens TaxID=2486417 RepID=A0A3M8T3B7_9ACTN|nr:hypothetical protein [Streptomyces botrytidirepellens]RNF87445.1 hypothetical protein EEJ42_42145 [Streptomyces botrytidirepellens]
MRIQTALSTLALAAAALTVGATGAAAADGPDVNVYNSGNTAFPGLCASNQFSFVTVPVNLLGASDSSSCGTH